MRSLCAVLLAAVFLVGFTAEADDPEPYPEADFSTDHTVVTNEVPDATKNGSDVIGLKLETNQNNSSGSCISEGALSADCSSWIVRCDGNAYCSVCEDDGSVGGCAHVRDLQ